MIAAIDTDEPWAFCLCVFGYALMSAQVATNRNTRAKER